MYINCCLQKSRIFGGSINGYFSFRRSLQFYRGPDYDINEEFCEMQEKHLSKVAEQIKSSSWKWTLERFFSMAFLKPFSCAGILSVLSMACGTNVVSTYMFFILQESGSLINPNLAPIIVGSVCLITSSEYR